MCQRCAAPFEWNNEEQRCITYCPPDASILDLNTGECHAAQDDMPPPSCAVEALNPINTMTGEKIERFEPDYSQQGELPLSFARNYASLRSPVVKKTLYKLIQTPQWMKYIQPDGYLGPTNYKPGEPVDAKAGYRQWKNNYDISLSVADSNGIRLELADGKSRFFKLDNGNYVALNELGDSLVAEGSGWLYTDAKGLKHSFNDKGQLTRLENQAGVYQNLAYDANDRLLSVTHANGTQLQFGYDANGLMTSMTTPEGDVIQYQYDTAHNNLVSVIYPDDTPADSQDNPKENYHYENVQFPYAMTGVSDANGIRYKTWGYDARGAAVSSSHAGGAEAGSIDFAADGSYAEVTHASGKKTKLTFTNGKIASIEGASCSTAGDIGKAFFSYDSKGRIISKTDEAGIVTHYSYNARGLRTEITEAYGTPKARTTLIEYHPTLAIPSKITEGDKVTDITITAGKVTNVSETSSGLTRSVSYSYYADGHVNQGLLQQIDGPRSDVSDVTSFTYDASGHLTCITNPLGQTVTFGNYTVSGLARTITDANGLQTTLTYDRKGQVLSTTVGTHTTSFQYDNVGQLTRVTLPGGAYTAYEYDDARRLTAIADALGNRLEYGYDASGNVTQIQSKDPQGALAVSMQMAYDQMNRLVSQTDGLGHSSSVAYDILGRQISDKSPMLKENLQAFDQLNRVIENTDAAGTKTQYGYDRFDRLVSVKDGNNAETQYQYDGLGNMTRQSSPDTGVTTFSYDSAGDLISRTDAKNVTVQFSYDALNRLTTVDYPDETLDVSYSYDTGANAKGRLSQVTDASGTTSYSYNALGQLASRTSTVSGHSFAVSYGYDSNGLLSEVHYPSGRILTLSRNAQGQIVGLSQQLGGTSQTLVSAAVYVPFGSSKQFTLGNGKTVSKTFNFNGQLTAIDTQGVYQTQLTYNPDADITATQGNHNQTFDYDLVDRLTAASGDFGNTSYSYDVTGNRQSKTENGVTESLSYELQSNRLADSFVHDAAGNRVQDALRTYQYGEDNRMKSAENTGTGLKTDYRYNAFGQRVSKSNLFGTVIFVYDESGRLMAEADGSGKVIKEYVYFDGQLLAMLVGE